PKEIQSVPIGAIAGGVAAAVVVLTVIVIVVVISRRRGSSERHKERNTNADDERFQEHTNAVYGMEDASEEDPKEKPKPPIKPTAVAWRISAESDTVTKTEDGTLEEEDIDAGYSSVSTGRNQQPTIMPSRDNLNGDDILEEIDAGYSSVSIGRNQQPTIMPSRDNLNGDESVESDEDGTYSSVDDGSWMVHADRAIQPQLSSQDAGDYATTGAEGEQGRAEGPRGDVYAVVDKTKKTQQSSDNTSPSVAAENSGTARRGPAGDVYAVVDKTKKRGPTSNNTGSSPAASAQYPSTGIIGPSGDVYAQVNKSSGRDKTRGDTAQQVQGTRQPGAGNNTSQKPTVKPKPAAKPKPALRPKPSTTPAGEGSLTGSGGTQTFPVAAVAGGVAASVLAIIVIIFIVFFIRRRYLRTYERPNRRRDQDTNPYTGLRPTGAAANGNSGDVNAQGVYEEINPEQRQHPSTAPKDFIAGEQQSISQTLAIMPGSTPRLVMTCAGFQPDVSNNLFKWTGVTCDSDATTQTCAFTPDADTDSGRQATCSVTFGKSGTVVNASFRLSFNITDTAETSPRTVAPTASTPIQTSSALHTTTINGITTEEPSPGGQRGDNSETASNGRVAAIAGKYTQSNGDHDQELEEHVNTLYEPGPDPYETNDIHQPTSRHYTTQKQPALDTVDHTYEDHNLDSYDDGYAAVSTGSPQGNGSFTQTHQPSLDHDLYSDVDTPISKPAVAVSGPATQGDEYAVVEKSRKRNTEPTFQPDVYAQVNKSRPKTGGDVYAQVNKPGTRKSSPVQQNADEGDGNYGEVQKPKPDLKPKPTLKSKPTAAVKPNPKDTSDPVKTYGGDDEYNVLTFHLRNSDTPTNPDAGQLYSHIGTVSDTMATP
ncbi:hypothetical protein BaRGS_00011688, partial [Batillaria attramentaria]